MEIRHLLYFKAVAEELHFRKAAERLFISQPPLSRQIKELEEELEVTLFMRNNKSVALTEAGKFFKQRVDEILAQLEEAKNVVKSIHKSVAGDFRIGFISSTFQNHLIAVLKDMGATYPYLHAKIYETSSAKQIKALETGKLDVGIVRSPVDSSHLEIIPLFQDRFVVVSAEPDLGLDELKSSSFIFFNRDYAPVFHQKLMEICHRLGFVPNILHEVNNIHAIINLVKKGLGVSILPQSVQEQYPDLHYTELDMPGIFTEVVLVHPKSHHHLALDWFVKEYSRSLNLIPK